MNKPNTRKNNPATTLHLHHWPYDMICAIGTKTRLRVANCCRCAEHHRTQKHTDQRQLALAKRAEPATTTTTTTIVSCH